MHRFVLTWNSYRLTLRLRTVNVDPHNLQLDASLSCSHTGANSSSDGPPLDKRNEPEGDTTMEEDEEEEEEKEEFDIADILPLLVMLGMEEVEFAIRFEEEVDWDNEAGWELLLLLLLFPLERERLDLALEILPLLLLLFVVFVLFLSILVLLKLTVARFFALSSFGTVTGGIANKGSRW